MQSSSHSVTTNEPTPSFLQAECPSCRPVNSVKALKGKTKMHMQVIDCIYVISGNNKFVLRHNVTGAPA